MAVYYFAWTDEATAFNPLIHATDDTKPFDGVSGVGDPIFTLEIEHSEGDFPSLRVEMRNERIGLLSAGRNLWCWLSEDSGSGAVPLFHGRLIGIPENLADEVWRLQFIARPSDYEAQKVALADSKRVLPWVDPIFIQENLTDADTVLEAYPERWHIDPVTLEVTASDIIAGEDGTLEVDEADHLYDGIEVSYSDPPLRSIALSQSVTWPQTGAGDVDLTRDLAAAFVAAGSPYPAPFVSSLTGDGLLSDWPAPLTDIGGGWSIAASATIEAATWIQPKAYVVDFGDRSDAAATLHGVPMMRPIDLTFGGARIDTTGALAGVNVPLTVPENSGADPFGNWEVAFQLGVYLPNFIVHFDAARDRSETVTATIEADVQALLVDPGAAETDTIELSSDFVGQPVDAGGALPIGDLRRNSYFKTDRGAQSFKYGLLLARAKLLSRSRAVQIKFTTPWSIAAGITCRKNVHLTDNRLPGGETTGKIIAYTLSASGEGEFKAEITIGCTIGYGVPLAAAATGTPTYVADGYVNDGYQQVLGGETALLVGELLYEDFDNFDVTDDDGVNLFDMRPATVLNSLTVSNGPTAQRAVIDAAARQPQSPDPVGALRDAPTEVMLDLVPVAGGAFHVDFAPDVSLLVVPQTINLEYAP